MILRAFSLALSQLGDPRFRKVLGMSLGLTLLLLCALYAVVFWLVGWLVGDAMTLPVLGQVTWVDDLLGWSSLILMMGLSVFLMVPVASAVISLFLDQVADAVEDRYYPSLPGVPGVPFAEDVRDALTALVVLIVANLFALILYVIFTPLAIFIFWALNGFLLGREYFTLAAMRRVGRKRARELRRRHLRLIWAAGVLMAIPLSVPLVNLLIPILGAATFTHIFHMLSGLDPSD
jgi:uncharacterized protein involved in cysteine biosynthesis